MTKPISAQVLGGRKGAFTRWSMAAPGESVRQARRGQAGFRRRFAREIDPEGRMAPEELERRVTLAVKAYMADLSLRRRRTRLARAAEKDSAA